MAAGLIGLLAITGAKAEPPGTAQPYADILNGPATNEELNSAMRAYLQCPTQACEVFRDVSRGLGIAFQRDHLNTMVQLRPRADDEQRREHVAELGLRHTLVMQRGERRVLYCAVLSKLATHYSDHYIGYVVLELASHIDAQARRHDTPCLPGVLAALPPGAEVDGLILEARERCQSEHRHMCGAIKHVAGSRRVSGQ